MLVLVFFKLIFDFNLVYTVAYLGYQFLILCPFQVLLFSGFRVLENSGV